MQNWSTEGLRPAEQFSYWREIICEAFAALDPRPSAHVVDAFPSQVTLGRFGAASGARIASCAHTVVRGFDQIRADPQDRLFVNVQLSGTGRVMQGERTATVPPGCFSVVDTARPYRLEFDGVFEVLSFRVPRELLLAQVSAPRQLTARTIEGRAGFGRLASGFMQSLMEAADTLPDDAGDELAARLCDFVAASARGDAATNLSASESAALSLVRKAQAHIQAALDDPALSAPQLASALGVSTRYLHKAFAQSGITAAGYIRALRLKHCAEDLANPRDNRTVSAIAWRWGLRDVPQFTRMFGKLYGSSPGAYRRSRRSAAR